MTAELYDTIGRTYGDTRHADPRVAAAILRALGDARTVLNVGAGAGNYEPVDREVMALEPSAVMIAQRPPGAARVVQGRAEELPFADGSFDVVISGLALHNIYAREERNQALREIARVLKPGGHVAIVDIDHTAEYERLLRESGVTEVKRVPSGPLATWLVILGTWGGVRPYRVIGHKPAA